MGVDPVSSVFKDFVDGGWGFHIWVAIVQSLDQIWMRLFIVRVGVGWCLG